MKSVFLFLLLFAPLCAQPLTLAGALARVESAHPLFRSRDALAALASARAAAAATRPPPEISLELENALGTGELRGAHSLESTLQFSRALDLAHRRDARSELARRASDVDAAAWQERQRELLAETARRFIRVAAAQAELAAAQELAALSRETLSATQSRFDRAAASASDLARARLALTDADLHAEHAEHQLLSARHQLATLWGAHEADFARAEANLAAFPDIAPYETLAAQLTEAPAQLRHAAVARWRLAQEQLSLANAARGTPRWSAGLRRVESSDDFGLVVGLGYTLPARDLAQAEAGEARAERERIEAERASALLDARALLFELCQELNHARIEHDAARDEMIPAAETWLSAVETGTPSGRYGIRDLLDARTALFNARQRQTAAAADFHRTFVGVEQLLGTSATP